MRDRRYEDDRRRRRDLTGIGGGLTAGGACGVLAAAALLGVSAPLGVIAAGLVGAALGAVAGWRLVARIDIEELDPNFTRRPHVGARSPDESPGVR